MSVAFSPSNITYRYDPSTPPYNFPVDKTTYTYDNKTAYTDPPDKGDLTKEARYDESDVAHTRVTYTYDAYGNRTNETRYRDAAAQLDKDLTIDSTYHAYVTQETIDFPPPAYDHTTTFGYDFILGKRTTATDPNGQTWNTKYDVHGRVWKEWSPGDSETSPTTEHVYAWDGTAPNQTTTKRLEQTGTTNVLTSWEWFDGLDRTIQRRAEGPDCSYDVGVVDTAYDATGQVASESIPYGNPSPPTCSRTIGDWVSDSNQPKTLYQFDAIGRETQVTNPNGSIRKTVYTGFNEAHIDENLHKTEQIKDAFGRVTQVKEYSGTDPYTTLYATTTFTYDLFDRQTGTTDHFNNPSATDYNMLGFVTRTVDPDRGEWTYTYYDDGLLKTRTDAQGAIATYAYDTLGRVVSRVYSGTVTLPPVTYTYDTCEYLPPCTGAYPVGRLSNVTFGGAAGGNRAYKHDARGRLIQEQLNINDLGWGIEHTYDSMDRETCTNYPDGEYVTTSFDAQGSVETVAGNTTSCTSAATTTYLSSSDYSGAGMPTRFILGNGLDVNYGYRSTDLRLSSITAPAAPATPLLSYAYDYDSGSKNIAETVDNATNPATTMTMTYDHRDRLTGVTGLGYPMSFQYDQIGNLTQKIETNNQSKDYGSLGYGVGDPGPHAVTSAVPQSGTTHSFTYDANGNTLTETAGTTVHQFTYDADGMVAYRNSPAEGEAYYYYDADGVLVRRAPSSTGWGTAYVGDIYEETAETETVTKYYFAAGQRIAMRKGGTLYYLTQDHLGGTALVTDGSGAMVSRIRYFPYGGIRTIEGANPPPTDKLFTGQQRETTNGLYHYKARMYNADIGRMPQADSFLQTPADPQSYNRYSYVQNNPSTYVDPTGYYRCYADADWWTNYAGGRDSILDWYDMSVSCTTYGSPVYLFAVTAVGVIHFPFTFPTSFFGVFAIGEVRHINACKAFYTNSCWMHGEVLLDTQQMHFRVVCVTYFEAPYGSVLNLACGWSLFFVDSIGRISSLYSSGGI